MAVTYFQDEGFQDALVSLLVKDRDACRLCQPLLSTKDFQPKDKSTANGKSRARWATALVALEHYEKYGEPIGRLVTAELRQYCDSAGIKNATFEDVLKYGKRSFKREVKAPEAITDKVVQFKREKIKQAAVEELIDLQSRGELTDDKWLEVSREAVALVEGNAYRSADYFEELGLRIDRRRLHREDRFPWLFIPELDNQVRAIARGHLGLVIGPYKRGKSLMLIHIAVAYVIQRLNVLYITLEDPGEDVEDRFDAAVTHLPIKRLNAMPKRLRERFQNFRRMIRARLKIVDATEKTVSVPLIENWIEEERNRGFVPDAIIIDYDDELHPVRKYNERRMEFAEIYRDLRRLAAKQRKLVWTAAQTQRGTAQVKMLTGDKLAEDVSKVRKVSFALGLGQGDWGDESVYLHVAAHKYDRQYVGCNVMSNKDRMLIYDRERTLKAIKNPPRPKEFDDDEEAA